MSQYTVEIPEQQERGIRVTCDEHGESEEFHPGHRKVAFCCDLCGYEVEVNLHDLREWRDLGEMC